jgi:hypothetical protein
VKKGQRDDSMMIGTWGDISDFRRCRTGPQPRKVDKRMASRRKKKKKTPQRGCGFHPLKLNYGEQEHSSNVKTDSEMAHFHP